MHLVGSLVVPLSRLRGEPRVVGKAFVPWGARSGRVLVAARHAVAVDEAAVDVGRGGRRDQALERLRGFPEVAPLDGGGAEAEQGVGEPGRETESFLKRRPRLVEPPE